MEIQKRRFWQQPWQYRESIALVTGCIVIGFLLQLTVGSFNFYLLTFPVNIILGIIILLFLGLFSIKKETKFYQWFSGVSFSVTLIVALLCLALIIGLTPQMKTENPHTHDIFASLGFRQMTSSWAFVLIYLLTILSLGSLIIRRLIAFRRQDYAFYLNHIGLWVLLFSAGLGAADTKRFVMHVQRNGVEWRVYSDNGEVLELPLAIQLNDFRMEVYPPKLAVINRKTGEVEPLKKPDYFQIDTSYRNGRLAGWDIHLNEYIHKAVRNSDSTYKEVPMPGAAPAAKITAVHKKTGQRHTGWVCGGNMAQLYMTLNLDSLHCVIMTEPEPKSFFSDIHVFTQDGKEDSTTLEVNHPLRIGSWTIYQYGYDQKAGNMSSYSSFELVYDPWLIPVYGGIILLALGSLCLLWNGNKKRMHHDLE